MERISRPLVPIISYNTVEMHPHLADEILACGHRGKRAYLTTVLNHLSRGTRRRCAQCPGTTPPDRWYRKL